MKRPAVIGPAKRVGRPAGVSAKKPGLKSRKTKLGPGKKGKKGRNAKVMVLEERLRKRQEDEAILLEEKTRHKKKKEEEFRHAHHIAQEKMPSSKVSDGKIKREIEEIDEEALRAIRAAQRNKAREDISWLRGVQVELATEIKELARMKRKIKRASRRNIKIPEDHIEWVNKRESHIKEQIKRVNAAIKNLTDIHSLTKDEGGEPGKLTQLRHKFRKAA